MCEGGSVFLHAVTEVEFAQEQLRSKNTKDQKECGDNDQC